MKLRNFVLAGILAITGAACGGSDDGGAIDNPTPTESGVTSGAVAVKGTIDNKWTPDTVEISVGDTVNWEWDGSHNVKFEDGTTSGDFVADGEYERTFDEAGTFNYVCEVHESVGMVGSVTVSEA